MKNTFIQIKNFVSHPVAGLKFLGQKIAKGTKKAGYFVASKFYSKKDIEFVDNSEELEMNFDELEELDETAEKYKEEKVIYTLSDDLLDVLSDYYALPTCLLSDKEKEVTTNMFMEILANDANFDKDIIDFLNSTRGKEVDMEVINEFFATKVWNKAEESKIEIEEEPMIVDFDSYNNKEEKEEKETSEKLEFNKPHYSVEEMAELEGKPVQVNYSEIQDFEDLLPKKEKEEKEEKEEVKEIAKVEEPVILVEGLDIEDGLNVEEANDVIAEPVKDEIKEEPRKRVVRINGYTQEDIEKGIGRLSVDNQDFIARAYGRETIEDQVNEYSSYSEIVSKIEATKEKIRKQKNKLVDTKIEYSISKDAALEEKIAKINRKIAKLELKLEALNIKLGLVKVKDEVKVEEKEEIKVAEETKVEEKEVIVVNKDDEIRKEIAELLFGTGSRLESNARVNGFKAPFIGIENVNPLDIRFQLDDCDVDKFYELKSKLGKEVVIELTTEDKIELLRKEIAELLIGVSDRFESNARALDLVSPYEGIENVNPYEICYQMEDNDVEKFYELKSKVDSLKIKKALSM